MPATPLSANPPVAPSPALASAAPGRTAGRPSAEVREVGLRDGLQSIAATVPTHHKTA